MSGGFARGIADKVSFERWGAREKIVYFGTSLRADWISRFDVFRLIRRSLHSID
jgi:hypothetical protein